MAIAETLRQAAREIDTIWKNQEQFKTIPVNERRKLAEFEPLESIIDLLDKGKLRAVTLDDGAYVLHETARRAINLYLMFMDMKKDEVGVNYKAELKREVPDNVRIERNGNVRFGAFLDEDTVVMPGGFVNLGGYVGSGTMVDTGARVGSCAQVGKNVHLAGGVGLGGVLEPPQAKPVVIEDHAFVGGNSEIAEGCIMREGAVLAPALALTASIKIYDPKQDILMSPGEIPPWKVAVGGSLPRAGGKYSVYALILHDRTPGTSAKLALNEALRG